MNNKNKKTLELLRNKPVPSNILWDDVESLFIALGADVTQGNGSRIRVKLNGVRAVFHKPHPEKNIDKGAVGSIIRFLDAAGIK